MICDSGIFPAGFDCKVCAFETGTLQYDLAGTASSTSCLDEAAFFPILS